METVSRSTIIAEDAELGGAQISCEQVLRLESPSARNTCLSK